MPYSATRGFYRYQGEKILPAIGLSLPLAALLFLVVSAFTYSSYRAVGKHPNISSQPSRQETPASSSTHLPSSSPAALNLPPATPASTSSIPAASSFFPPSSPTPAGFIDSQSPKLVSDDGSALPAALTVPAVNVQAEGKTILQTTPTTLTIN